MTVSDDGVTEAEVVSTDLKPAGEDDAICVQHMQTEEKANYWTQTEWVWVKALYEHQ